MSTDLADLVADLQTRVAQLERVTYRRGPGRYTRRRELLRQARDDHFDDLSRGAAAVALSGAWREWKASPPGAAPPGPLAAIFAELDALGFEPLGVRSITEDLDEAVDRYRRD